MTDRPLVLVLSNDFSLAAAKTSRHLSLALNRLGFNAICRDTSLVRWGARQAENTIPMRREAYETAVVAKWNKFLADYGVDLVVSLDLHWLFTSQLFFSADKIKKIHSFWFDDIRSHFKSAGMFSLAPQTPLGLITDPKVTHHCYGSSQAEELREFGVKNLKHSALAAPAEMLKADHACTQMSRLAFIGNPGVSAPPSDRARAAMERGESLAALQRTARQEIVDDLPVAEKSSGWVRENPRITDLLAAATELRLTEPHTAAISLLRSAGKSYPDAFDDLNRSGSLLDAALLVKMVNRYDRPALVHRFWKRGQLDVYGTPEQWEPFGISAMPTVPFPRLASVYRQYPAHLNAPNCARDASANEKLFEIAACARLSLNLDSPDVRACYSEDEVVLAESEEALENAFEGVLKDPDAALAAGEAARVRTAHEHLWDHRMEKALS